MDKKLKSKGIEENKTRQLCKKLMSELKDKLSITDDEKLKDELLSIAYDPKNTENSYMSEDDYIRIFSKNKDECGVSVFSRFINSCVGVISNRTLDKYDGDLLYSKLVEIKAFSQMFYKKKLVNIFPLYEEEMFNCLTNSLHSNQLILLDKYFDEVCNLKIDEFILFIFLIVGHEEESYRRNIVLKAAMDMLSKQTTDVNSVVALQISYISMLSSITGDEIKNIKNNSCNKDFKKELLKKIDAYHKANLDHQFLNSFQMYFILNNQWNLPLLITTLCMSAESRSELIKYIVVNDLNSVFSDEPDLVETELPDLIKDIDKLNKLEKEHEELIRKLDELNNYIDE